MKDLRSLITLLYKRIPPDYVFKASDGFRKGHKAVVNEILFDDTLYHRLQELLPYRSHDEIVNTWQKAQEIWSRRSKYGGNNGPREGASTVFNLLTYFTNETLLLEKNTPVVQYDNLLQWRKLSLQLGEDLLTCSFTASRDLVSNHSRTFFAWSPILGTNNIRLRNMLSKGVAENHFHLTGSSPYFEISWVSLMNQIEGRKQEFDEFRKKKNPILDPDVQYSNNYSEDLQILTIKAAYIRLLLFRLINAEKFGWDFDGGKGSTKPSANNSYSQIGVENEENLMKLLLVSPSNHENYLSHYPYVLKLQQQINTYRYLCALEFKGGIGAKRLDYAITKDMAIYKDNANLLLCGERKLLYDCFKAIEKGEDKIIRYQDLFYAYLIIKERLRKELIQINDSVGFTNFKLYQDRKDVFIRNRREYDVKLQELAIKPTIENQYLEHIEARIKPSQTLSGIIKKIGYFDWCCLPSETAGTENDFLSIDSAISSPYCKKRKVYLGKAMECLDCREKKCIRSGGRNERLHYVFHFTKSKDNWKERERERENEKLKVNYIESKSEDISSSNIELMRCRDHEKREEVKKEAYAIDSMLCSLNPMRFRIVGIDAASSELDNRPEVFGQAFRFLKGKRDRGEFGHLVEDVGRPQIRATFHVGEDFLDLVDGLRAIDEAIKFLGLGQGDRIGHAMALGINVHEYYESKHKSIVLPKQWHLDNLCWLISRVHKYNLHKYSSSCQDLRWDFKNLFNKMYNGIESIRAYGEISPELYFESWRLRGDAPEMYSLNSKEEIGSGKDKYQIKVNDKNRLTYWQKCGINKFYPTQGVKREFDLVNRLYYEYHYNPELKKRGEEMFPFEIKKEYIELVDAVQKCYQKEIRERHLAIETNPSSNVLIGTFKRYDKHPLVNLFNLGLETDPEKIRNCPQLFVSINTDDQGVFNTYLENEYALMALALEKMEDENGNKLYNPAMIYDWLDRIRAMGMEMRFGKV